MRLERYKKLLQLILDELNVVEISFYFGSSDAGEIRLVFNGDFYWKLGGVKLEIRDEINIVKLLDIFYETRKT